MMEKVQWELWFLFFPYSISTLSYTNTFILGEKKPTRVQLLCKLCVICGLSTLHMHQWAPFTAGHLLCPALTLSFPFWYLWHLCRNADRVTHELALTSPYTENDNWCWFASCSMHPACRHKKLLLLNSCEIQLGNYHLRFLTSCLVFTCSYKQFGFGFF